MEDSVKAAFSALIVCSLVIICNSAYSNGADKLESDFFDSPEIKIHLAHSFRTENANESFTPRGTIEIRSFKGPKFTAEQPELSLQDLDSLKEISLEDGYYFLQMSTKGSSGLKTYRAFIPARSLLDSGLSDVFHVHVNPSGEIYAISYSVAATDYFSTPNVLVNRPPPTRFNTSVQVHHGEIGPVPDTAPYLEKLEQERISKERGEDTRDNRSFLVKYWMYIVPVLILVLVSGASNPEGGDGGGR